MSHISTLMAADVTPLPNEIETGSCNMLVKGNLPDGSPFSLFFTTVRPLIISSVTPSSFFIHPKLILQPSCGHASSVPHRVHLIEYIKQSLQTFHILHGQSKMKKSRRDRKRHREGVEVKEVPWLCYNVPNVHLPSRWNTLVLQRENESLVLWILMLSSSCEAEIGQLLLKGKDIKPPTGQTADDIWEKWFNEESKRLSSRPGSK